MANLGLDVLELAGCQNHKMRIKAFQCENIFPYKVLLWKSKIDVDIGIDFIRNILVYFFNINCIDPERTRKESHFLFQLT